jgi:hypothetical protein
MELFGSINVAHGSAWEDGYYAGMDGEQIVPSGHVGYDSEFSVGYEYGELDRLSNEAKREQAELRPLAQGG